MEQKNYKIFSKTFNKSSFKTKEINFKSFNKKLNKYNFKVSFSSKMINCLMIKGNKSLVEKLLFKTFKILQESSLKNSNSVVKFSLLNISPILSVFQKKNKKRVLREIPFLLKPTLRLVRAIKSIIKIVKKQSQNSFSENLKNEIINILKKNSDLLVKKNDLHSYALKNKAFAHFRWF
jgi:small subunit ribosomal protein S7